MITYILIAVLGAFLLVNYKKAFIIYFAISPLLEQFGTFGTTSLYTILSVIILVLVPFKFQDIWKGKRAPFLLTLILYSSSFVCTFLFGATKSSPLSLLRLILTNGFNIYMFILLVKSNPKYLRLFIKTIFIFALIFSSYSIIETIIGSNPYIDFVKSNGLYVSDTVVEDIRFGFKRSQSIFSMHTTLGYLSGLCGFFLLFVKNKTNILKGNLVYIVVAFCFVSVFLSGARSMIAGLAVYMLTFINKKYIKPRYLVLATLLFVVLYFPLADFWRDIYLSFTDTESVSGSNTEMREDQLAVATMFLDKSFLFGNGLLYTFTTVVRLFPDINGAESIWYPTMIDQGIYGVICTVIVYISIILYAFRQDCKLLIFFIIGNIISYSMSSIPGTSYFYFIAFLVSMVYIENRSLKNM